MNISIQQLEYIVAVDQYRHFVTAAEKTYVTQPTLSMQIKKMEEELGVLLFDRTKQPLIPTDVGKKVIKQAREIINQTRLIEEIVKSHKGIVSGEFRLGIIPTLAPYLVPKFVGSLIRTYPKIELTIKELQTQDILSALKNEDLDAGIIVTPLDSKRIKQKHLFYEEIVLYCDEAQKNNYLKFNQLPTENMWLLSEGHCFRNQMINLCKRVNEGRDFTPLRYESGSIETLKKMVDAEGGATLFPELATEDLSEEEKQKLIQIGKTPPYREISLVYNRSQAKIKLIEIIEEEVKKAVPKKMLSKQENVVEWN